MARRSHYKDEMYYRMYVTDGLRVVGNLNKRWIEMIADKPVEKRTAEEIKSDLKAKIRRMANGSV